MAQYLKQSTSTTVTIGPAVDISDAVTPETGLAAGTVDEIGVYKHEATSLTDISGDTTMTHRAGGMYTVTLDTGDTDTVGRLRLFIRDDDVCLPMWKDFMVLPANVFDSWLGTDKLDVNVAEVSDDSTAADNLELITELSNITSLVVDANGRVDVGSIEGGDATDAINSEMDTAIEDYHLDHLLAADYDPSSKPGVATALLNELVENDGGVSRFTSNALEAITDDDTQIDASALNTLSGHDPGGTIAAQTDITGLNDLSAADVLSAVTDDDNKIDGSALNTLSGHDPGSTIAAQSDVTGLNDITVADIIAGISEGAYDLQEIIRIIFSALAGKSTGGGTVNPKFRDVADSKDRISATVDADGNRTSVTLDGS